MSDLESVVPADAPDPAATTRIEGFDIARAVAIFGMVTVNFRAVLTRDELPEWLHRAVEQVDGRAAALFVFLAGVGISLLSARSRASGDPVAIRADRLLLLKRALFLFILGMAFRRIWDFDILHFYGIYLLAAALLLTLPGRGLVAIGIVLTALFPLLYYVLPAWAGIPFWDTTSALTPRDVAIDLFFQGYHPVAPWLVFLLAGMIVGRLDLADRAVRRRMLVGGVIVALVAEGLSSGLLTLGWLKAAFDIASRASVEAAADAFGTAPYPPMPLFVLVGLGWASAIVALCLSLGDRSAGRAWFTPFAHTGQLALSIYIFHGTVGIWVASAIGRGQPFSLVAVLVYCAGFYVVTVILATLWRRFFARGPVEAIMRWATRNRRSEISPEGPVPVSSGTP